MSKQVSIKITCEEGYVAESLRNIVNALDYGNIHTKYKDDYCVAEFDTDMSDDDYDDDEQPMFDPNYIYPENAPYEEECGICGMPVGLTDDMVNWENGTFTCPSCGSTEHLCSMCVNPEETGGKSCRFCSVEESKFKKWTQEWQDRYNAGEFDDPEGEVTANGAVTN